MLWQGWWPRAISLPPVKWLLMEVTVNMERSAQQRVKNIGQPPATDVKSSVASLDPVFQYLIRTESFSGP